MFHFSMQQTRFSLRVSVWVAAAFVASAQVVVGGSNVRTGDGNCVAASSDGGCITEMADCKHGSFIFLAQDAVGDLAWAHALAIG